MAMLEVREGILVFVPWRIQGIIHTEDRLCHQTIKLLKKQTDYTLKSLALELTMAKKKLQKLKSSLSNSIKVPSDMKSAKLEVPLRQSKKRGVRLPRKVGSAVHPYLTGSGTVSAATLRTTSSQSAQYNRLIVHPINRHALF